MCNLYSITKNQDAIRQLLKVTRDVTGNLPPLPGNYPAPVVRALGAERELTMMRWGMPGPPQFRSLAAMAWTGEPLPRAHVVVLRIRRHETEDDTDVVCLRR